MAKSASTKHQTSKITTQGASAASSKARTWGKQHNIERLRRECQSRGISIPGKRLKKAEYVDKIQEYDAKGNGKAPRLWGKLNKDDLVEECQLRDINLTGPQTKLDIIKQLEKSGPKVASKPGLSSQSQSNPPSKRPQKNSAASSTSTGKYDGYKAFELKQHCRDRGVLNKLTRRAQFIDALIKADEEDASKGLSGPGQSPAGNAGQSPAGSAGQSKSGSSGRSPGPANGQSGTGGNNGSFSGGNILSSPATIVGASLSSPIAAPPQVLEAARKNGAMGVHTKGFRSSGWHCYRNAVFVMLLHSRRIHSWIEHSHIPELESIGFDLEPNCGNGSTEEARINNPHAYTDVWCEFYEFSKAYWADSKASQATVHKAMSSFWDYLSHDDRATEENLLFGRQMKIRHQHQDVSEFLGWLIELSLCQLTERLTTHFDFQQVPADSPLRNKKSIESKSIRGLVNVAQTSRVLCTQRPDFRHLVSQAETSWLELYLPDRDPDPSAEEDASARDTPIVTLEQCLAHNSKFEVSGYRCKCPVASHQNGVNNVARLNPPPKNNGRRKIRTRPEVLFVKLEPRWIGKEILGDKRGTTKIVDVKDGTIVQIPRQFDLSPFLDSRYQPANVSATYDLKAIVSHDGDRDSGHYIAQIPYGDRWTVFNDARKPTKVTLDDIINHRDEAGNSTDFYPFILMYERIPEDAREGEVNDDDGDEENGHDNRNASGRGIEDPSAKSNGDTKHSRGNRHNKDPDSSGNADGNGKDAGPDANDNGAGNERQSRSPRPPQLSKGSNAAPEKSHRAHNHNQDDEKLDIFVRFCSNIDASWREKNAEQTRRIVELEDTIRTLSSQHADLKGLVALDRKRRHDQISDDDNEEGVDYDTTQFKKRLRQIDHPGASTDVVVGSPDDIANMGTLSPDGYYDLLPENDDVYDSDGRLIDDGYHDAISHISGGTGRYASFEEEERPEVTDSDSASMSESEEEVQNKAHEKKGDGEEEILSSPLDLGVYEDYRTYRDQLILANLDLVREREVAKHAFADDYANQHNIFRGQGPWSWMGPRHQEHFEQELEWFLDQWNELVLERTAREEQEWRRQLAQAMRDFEAPRTPSYTPNSPGFAPTTPNYEPDSPNFTPNTPTYGPTTPTPTAHPRGFHKRAPTSTYSQTVRRLFGTPNGHLRGNSLPDYVDSDAETSPTANLSKKTTTAASAAPPPNKAKTSPSAKFYNIGRRHGIKTSPHSDRVSKKTTLTSSPRKNQIPTTPISSPGHPARTPLRRNPVTPPQATWLTPAAPRRSARLARNRERPSPIQLRFSPALGQVNGTVRTSPRYYQSPRYHQNGSTHGDWPENVWAHPHPLAKPVSEFSTYQYRYGD